MQATTTTTRPKCEVGTISPYPMVDIVMNTTHRQLYKVSNSVSGIGRSKINRRNPQIIMDMLRINMMVL